MLDAYRFPIIVEKRDFQGTTRQVVLDSGGRESTIGDHSGRGSHSLGYNETVTDLGKLLILVGVVIVGIGVVLALAGRSHLPLGRLPGDIVYRGKNTTFYFPLATSILISLVLSVLLYLIGRFRR
jgi:hypothetical protein